MTGNQEKKPIEVSPKMTWIVELADKDFKAIVWVMFKDIKEKIVIISEQIGNFSREVKTLK